MQPRGAAPISAAPPPPALAPRWYVARSKPRAERLAAAAIEARDLTAFVPERRRMARGGLEVVEILFPCYLFVQSDGEPDWVLRARSAPNVMRLLGGSAGPEPVPDRLVRALRSRGLEPIVPNRFLPGQRVRISDGAFRDIEGIFECEYPGERARIFIQLLRRLVPVIVDVADLRDPS